MNSSVFSFFSGSGFLDLGFEYSNFEIVFVNELDASFMGAYKYSRSKLGLKEPVYGHHIKSIDIFLSEESEKSELRSYVEHEREKGKAVGFVGGPPCPDFSVGGKNRGKEGENGKLSQSYIDTIISQQPDWFVFENVKGLWRTKKHKEFFEQIKKQLESSGYIVEARLMNAIEFGAPQDRDRIIMFGVHRSFKKSLKGFDWIKYMDYPGRTAFDYSWPERSTFGETPIKPDVPEVLTVKWWFDKNDVENHPNAKHSFQPRAGLAKFLVIDEGDTTKKSYKRLHRWRYSPTAAYGNNEVHLHPWLPRRLSAAEAMAIQSLPKEFELPPEMTLSAMFKTIGNGVPFKFSNGLAKSITCFLEDK